jgi:hypothetical protein
VAQPVPQLLRRPISNAPETKLRKKYFSLCQPSKQHQVGTLCSGSNGNSELSSALVVEHQPVGCQPLVHNLKTPSLHFENFESVSIRNVPLRNSSV